jgi:hypothetical protein
VPFIPTTIALHEAGPDAPYKWKLTEPLQWTGNFRGRPQQLEVPTSPEPFTTDLASVPRSLTWLFPRYGKYTKAAVVHDYLCQNFKKQPDSPTEQSLLPLRDRSDADELFRSVMAELGVPWLRRWLMWAAVSWATLFTSLVPGRRSVPAAVRWLGRLVALAAVAGSGWLLIARHDRAALIVSGLVVPAALLVAGTIALGRFDRVIAALAIYPTTLCFSPLIATGVAVAIIFFVYLIVEDIFGGLPGARRLLRDLYSRDAKLAKVATPQFARLAEVMKS